MQTSGWAVVVALAVVTSPAVAEPRQCLGRGEAQWIVDSTLLGVVNPLGFEEQLRANACLPLTRRTGLLFDYAQLETGVFSYLGPVFAHLGGYVSVAPLSFLVLRADAAGVGVWPLPLDGAGYFALPGYADLVPDAAVPAAQARSAFGANVTFTATLQASLPLSSRLELVGSNSFGADWWTIGKGAYYVNLRRDVVLARSDWLLKNTALLALELKPRPGVSVRVGAIDDLTWVPASGIAVNQLQGFLSVPVRREAALRDLEPFVRAGLYTQRGGREGFTLMVGLSLAWALPTRPARR